MDFYRKVGEFAYMSYNVHGHMKMNISANDMMTGENDFFDYKIHNIKSWRSTSWIYMKNSFQEKRSSLL